MAVSILTPFPVIADIDGQPLDDGYIWIGVNGLDPVANPQTVYWDAALTDPATQPVRTRGGFALDGTARGRLFASGVYSIRVDNQNGSTVYSSLSENGLYGGNVDASGVNFVPAGANAVTRTAQTKMRETISVDDYTTLTAAIASAKVSGRPTVVLINGSINVAATVVVDAPNITLQGAGGDSVHDVGTQGAGARGKLIWTGAPGGTILQFASPVGAGNQACTGGGVLDLYFGCDNSAAIGLQVLSWRKGTFENLHFNNPTTVGLDVGVVATLGEARDTQNCVFRNLSSRQLEVTGGAGGLIRLGGDATANTSLNYFEQLDCQYLNGSAYLFNNCDNNYILRARAFRAGGGTGAALLFNGSNSAADQVARANIFVHLTTNGPLPSIMRGTSSFTHASANNSVLLMDQDNGYQAPTYETGATGVYTDTRGYMGGSTGGVLAIQVAIGEVLSSLNNARTRLASSTSLHIANGNDDNMRLSNNAGDVWGFNLNGTGDLRASRISGTGSFNIGGSVIYNSQLISVGAADSAGAGFRQLRVPN